MSTTLLLRTYERDGEVNPSSIPNIAAVFVPSLIEELRRHDPDFHITLEDIETDRIAVPEDKDIPIAELAKANLVFCIIFVSGNDKLEANRDEVEATVSRMLRGLLHPIPGVHAILYTGQ